MQKVICNKSILLFRVVESAGTYIWLNNNVDILPDVARYKADAGQEFNKLNKISFNL